MVRFWAINSVNKLNSVCLFFMMILRNRGVIEDITYSKTYSSFCYIESACEILSNHSYLFHRRRLVTVFAYKRLHCQLFCQPIQYSISPFPWLIRLVILICYALFLLCCYFYHELVCILGDWFQSSMLSYTASPRRIFIWFTQRKYHESKCRPLMIVMLFTDFLLLI